MSEQEFAVIQDIIANHGGSVRHSVNPVTSEYSVLHTGAELTTRASDETLLGALGKLADILNSQAETPVPVSAPAVDLTHLGALFDALKLPLDATGNDLVAAVQDLVRARDAMRVYNALTETLIANGWEFRMRRRPETPIKDRWDASVYYKGRPLAGQLAPSPVIAIRMLLERLPGPAGVSREQMQQAAKETIEWATVLVMPVEQKILRQSSGVHPDVRVSVARHDGGGGAEGFVLFSTMTGLTIGKPWAYDDDELRPRLRSRLFIEARGQNILVAVPTRLADRILDAPPASGKRTGKPVCPDGGVCHHECPVDPRTLGAVSPPDGRPCFRVLNASPLGGVFSEDRWPPATVKYHREADGAEVHRQSEGDQP